MYEYLPFVNFMHQFRFTAGHFNNLIFDYIQALDAILLRATNYRPNFDDIEILKIYSFESKMISLPDMYIKN